MIRLKAQFSTSFEPRSHIMTIDLISQDLDSVTRATSNTILVLFSSVSDDKSKTPVLHNKLMVKQLETNLDEKSISGKANEVVLFRDYAAGPCRHLLVIGLGPLKSLTAESFRQCAAAIHDYVKQLNYPETFIDFDSFAVKQKNPANLQALIEGLVLSAYEFNKLKSKNKDKKEKAIDLLLHIALKESKTLAFKKAFLEALTLADAVNFARFLGDMPGNLMTPEILAQSAMDAAKDTKIKATIWNKERIKKERMGGLLGVSMGSEIDPRFIILEYSGTAKTKKPLVFVGKGLTFDSGGISIKPSAAMEEMKYDMCGGANVIATILAIAKLKLKVNVIGLIPATENMPGPLATKPGDVHTSRNGKTFEINNTDAEGRLILSDALAYASEQKPEIIIDAATLTGAMVVALGNTHTGYFTRNEKLKKTIEDAARITGEWVWNMPLCDFHVQDMKGTFADFSNISSGKGAGSATAAAFLEQFVEEGIPWAHFDIAGTGWAVGNRLKYCSKKGASGVMVRTFVEIARSFE